MNNTSYLSNLRDVAGKKTRRYRKNTPNNFARDPLQGRFSVPGE